MTKQTPASAKIENEARSVSGFSQIFHYCSDPGPKEKRRILRESTPVWSKISDLRNFWLHAMCAGQSNTLHLTPNQKVFIYAIQINKVIAKLYSFTLRSKIADKQQ